MTTNPLILHMAKALANFHLKHVGGADGMTLVEGQPNWRYFTNEATAVFEALKTLPPGLGQYQDVVALFAEDALR